MHPLMLIGLWWGWAMARVVHVYEAPEMVLKWIGWRYCRREQGAAWMQPEGLGWHWSHRPRRWLFAKLWPLVGHLSELYPCGLDDVGLREHFAICWDQTSISFLRSIEPRMPTFLAEMAVDFFYGSRPRSKWYRDGFVNEPDWRRVNIHGSPEWRRYTQKMEADLARAKQETLAEALHGWNGVAPPIGLDWAPPHEGASETSRRELQATPHGRRGLALRSRPDTLEDAMADQVGSIEEVESAHPNASELKEP